MPQRKSIPKDVRQRVYEKYGGRCAYCGKKIAYKDMQVDHIIPLGRSIYYQSKEEQEKVRQMIESGEINNIDNLMPACRACNFYKGAERLDSFRSSIADILDKTCRSSFQVKLALQYGILSYKPWGGKFYFERFRPEQCYYKAGKSWAVNKLWEATKENKVTNVKVESFLSKDNYWNIGNFRELAYEMHLALEADYTFPIIIDTENNIIDGAHRLVHAYIDKVEWVPAVTIWPDQWPEPDYDETIQNNNNHESKN